MNKVTSQSNNEKFSIAPRKHTVHASWGVYELMNLFLPSCESHFPDKCTHLTFSFGLNEENTIVAFLHRLFKLGFTMESSFSLVNSHFVFPSLNAWRSIIMQAKIFVLWFIRPPLYPMNARDHMSGAMHTPTSLPLGHVRRRREWQWSVNTI